MEAVTSATIAMAICRQRSVIGVVVVVTIARSKQGKIRKKGSWRQGRNITGSDRFTCAWRDYSWHWNCWKSASLCLSNYIHSNVSSSNSLIMQVMVM